MPEAVVDKDAELASRCEVGHRLFFPHRCIALDVITYLGRQDKEAAVDPAAVAAWLFLKAGDAIALMVDCAIAAGRLRSGDSGEAPLAPVKGDALCYINIGNTIAVSQTEGVIIADVRKYPFDASANHRFFAGVD